MTLEKLLQLPKDYWDSRSPAVKLTAAYVLILLVLCLGFSFILYHFAVGQVADSLRRQYMHFNPGQQMGPPPTDTAANSQIQSYLDAASRELIFDLIYFNAIILAAGTALSYWLARRTVRPIETALEAQSRFTADASHELRTPLAVMQTEIEIARADPKLTKDEAFDLLDSNLEEVKKLHSLADGLLQLARTDSQPLTMAQVSLGSIAAAAIDHTMSMAKARQITLANDTTDTAILGNEGSLVELVAILLDNAIKYSPAGSTVTLKSSTKNHQAGLAIIDHGRGIADVDLPHIFDRFYRADKSRTGADVKGHGLGLSIAKKIADLNTAEITVSSKPGSGSTFQIKLPLA